MLKLRRELSIAVILCLLLSLMPQVALAADNLAITSAGYTQCAAGGAFTFTVKTSALPTAPISASGLPGWVSLTDKGDGTATLAGTAPGAGYGIYTFDIIAKNSVGTATQNFTLYVYNSISAGNSPKGPLIDHNNNLWVLNGQSVMKFSADCSILGSFACPNNGNAIAEDPDGYIWVSTVDGVRKLTPDGVVLGAYSLGSGVLSMVIDSSGNIWAGLDGGSDYHKRAVVKVSSNGAILATYAAPIMPDHPPLTIPPQSLALDAPGNIWVCGGPYIYKLSPDGMASSVYTTGATQPFHVIAIDPSGNLWVTANDSVEKFDPEGDLLGTYDVGFSVRNINTDRFGNVWATGSSTVSKLSSDGKIVATFTGFSDAQRVAVDKDGNAWVPDDNLAGTGRFMKIPPSNTAPSIVSTGSAQFSLGTFGSFTVTAEGFPSPSLALVGTLPGGLVLTDQHNGTAAISGMPSGTAGVYTFSIRASNSAGAADTQTFSLTVSDAAAAPSITSVCFASFSAGVSGSYTITASGCPAPVLSISGTLPEGLNFADNGNGTATISGRTAADCCGEYPITVTAKNTDGTATQAFTLRIIRCTAITSGNGANFVDSGVTCVNFFIKTTGYPAPAIWTTGALPAGVTLTNNQDGTATLNENSGTAQPGTYSITIHAYNGVGAEVTQSFTITMTDSPLTAYTYNTSDLVLNAWEDRLSDKEGNIWINGIADNGKPNVFNKYSRDDTLLASHTVKDGIRLTVMDGQGNIWISYSDTCEVDKMFPDGEILVQYTLDELVYAMALDSSDNLWIGYTDDTGNACLCKLSPDGALLLGPIQVGSSYFKSLAIDDEDNIWATYSTDSGLCFNASALPMVELSSGGEILQNQPGFGYTLLVSDTSGSVWGIRPDPIGVIPLHSGKNKAGAYRPKSCGVAHFPEGIVSCAVDAYGNIWADLKDKTLNETRLFELSPSGETLGEYGGQCGNTFTIDPFGTVNIVSTNLYLHLRIYSPSCVMRFTSADEASFTDGEENTFTVTVSGYPFGSVSLAGDLPDGVSFINNGDGSATLSGTPAAGTGGTYPLIFTAMNGITTDTQSFTLTVSDIQSSAKAITGFKIGSVDGTINETNHTIAITLPYGTAVTSLTPTIAVSDKASVSPASGTATDFTSPVTYTVTAENGTTQDYTVTVTVEADTRSSAKAITGFTIGGIAGTISETDHTIAVAAPYGTDVTSLTPTITVSDKATVSPTSGTAQDFTTPVAYTVTAEDGTTQTYTVTVTVESGPDIVISNTYYQSRWAVSYPFSCGLQATGLPVITWSLLSGDLPDGITFNSDGWFTGTPTEMGFFEFTVQATNGVKTASTTLNLTIYPAITPDLLPAGTIGMPYSQTLTAPGVSNPQWRIFGDLPDGLSLNENTGVLSGTPTEIWHGYIDVAVTNTELYYPHSIYGERYLYLIINSPASFDKYASGAGYADISMTLTPTLSGVWNGSTQLSLNTDYTVLGSTVAILKSYLALQPEGTTTLTFKFSNSSDQTLAITVVDTTPRSSAKAITGFTISGVAGTINETTHAIALTLPYGTAVTSLTPIITVSDKASVSPASGTAQNFTNPVAYTVTAENGTTQDYTVTVTVSPANSYSISLDKSGTQTFSAQTAGYSSVSPLNVKVSNTGNQATGALTVALSGTNASSFTLSKTTIGSIAKAGSDTFTIKPNDSLTNGTYMATVTVSGDNVTSQTFTVSFTVNAAASADKTLLSVTNPTAITGVANGTAKTAPALGLPSTVTLVTDGGNVQAGVTWAVYGCSYDPSVTTEQIFTVGGTVTLPSGVVNTNGVSLDVTISVTVNAASTASTYTITASAGSGGSISPSGAVSVTEGGSKTFKITPNAGYLISSVMVDSTTQGAISTYTFTNVTANHTISATFSLTGGGEGSSSGDSTPSTPSTPTYNADVKAGNGIETTLTVTVDKDSGTASIDTGSQSLAQAGTVITIPSVPDINTFTIGIPVPDLSTTDVQGTLTLNTGTGSINVPSDMLTGVSGISGSKAEISIGQGDKSNLPDDVKSSIGDRPLIQLTLSIDGKQTDWNNPSVPVTVSIPYTPTAEELARSEHINIWYIDGSGKAVSMNGRYDQSTGTVIFTTTHFSVYAVVYDPMVRLAGENRIETALSIAQAAYPGKIKSAVLATADNYPDALAGSVLAYQLGAPILLVGSSEADQEKVVDYLKANLEQEGTVYILGGTAVVSSGMDDKIQNSGFNHIIRIVGETRYDTAVKIAEQLNVKTGTPVVLVNGENYPDALAVSSIAAQNQFPILLVQKDGIDESVSKELAAIKPDKIYIIGLQGAISPAVETQAAKTAGLAPENIVRIGGANRYTTSLAVAEYFNSGSQTICIATGNNFPDTLAGSIYAAKYKAPIILTDKSIPEQIMDYIESRKPAEVVIFGGEAVVGSEIEQTLREFTGVRAK